MRESGTLNFQWVTRETPTASGDIPWRDLAAMTGERMGRHDVACPLCGPSRKAPANRVRKVLRVWIKEPGFASYTCSQCGAHGWARDRDTRRIDPATFDRLRKEAETADNAERTKRHDLALFLWKRARPIAGTIAETYLRGRGIVCDLPSTLRFLPTSRPDRHPAMIAAFGPASETAPGRVEIRDDAVTGVHLTLLRPDGSGKADVDPNKLMIGRSLGSPIVLAAPNDLLALALIEGIEDALSLHQGTGIGAWAAGAAGRFPALAEAVPSFLDLVHVGADDDEAGEAGARSALTILHHRGIPASRLVISGGRA